MYERIKKNKKMLHDSGFAISIAVLATWMAAMFSSIVYLCGYNIG